MWCAISTRSRWCCATCSRTTSTRCCAIRRATLLHFAAILQQAQALKQHNSNSNQKRQQQQQQRATDSVVGGALLIGAYVILHFGKSIGYRLSLKQSQRQGQSQPEVQKTAIETVSGVFHTALEFGDKDVRWATWRRSWTTSSRCSTTPT